jgi:elongation factor G
MQEGQPVRNIGFLAHIDAGKTSVTEAVLLAAGAIRAAGSVDQGSTETDWMDIERERGITINAAATHCAWGGARISILDTPGHVDFGAEVTRSLRILDGAVALLCGVAGVQAQTEAIWRSCDRAGLPRLAFINKLDRRGASFERVLRDMGRKLGCRALAIQYPLESEGVLQGLYSLDHERFIPLACVENPAASAPPLSLDAWAPHIASARSALLEALADLDEGIMADLIHDQEVSAPRLRAALRSACISGAAVPVLGGSAFSSASVEALLDAVLDYLPSPAEARPQAGFDPSDGRPLCFRPDPEEAFSALIFKQEVQPGSGVLSHLRIFSGRLRAGETVWNASAGAKERILSLYRMRANRPEALSGAQAGDIVAATGIKPAQTGHSLCRRERPIVYEAITFPEPVVSVALEPASGAEADALARAVAELCGQDPSLRAEEEAESGRLRLSGQGELHLEVAVQRLAREYGQRPRVGKPEVSLRETIAGPLRGRADFDREIDYKRHFASVEMALLPAVRGAGIILRDGTGNARPQHQAFVQAALRGGRQALDAGTRFGYSATDIVLELVSMRAEAGSSSVLAFEAAGSMAVRAALLDAKPIILEPWMRLEMGLPEEALGQVVQALAGRQGRIEMIEDVPGGKVVSAFVAMRALFGLAGELRAHARGRISLSQTFHRYEAVHLPPG